MIKREIYILEEDGKLQELLKQNVEVTVRKGKDWKEALEAMIILIHEEEVENSEDICKKIKDVNDMVPIVVYASHYTEKHAIELLKCGANIYVNEISLLPYTVKNLLTLLQVNRMSSPLTGLPGNGQIEKELEKRCMRGDEFAVLYVDLNNFKAYNDSYGFMAGDKMIKYTANLLQDYAEGRNNFVGHIGGDDFVAIVEDNYEKICQNIILQFDKKIKEFFSEQDQKNGYIEVANRKGKIEKFPLTTISIGVVPVMSQNRYDNIGEIALIGTQMKKFAKQQKGSYYAINKRKK